MPTLSDMILSKVDPTTLRRGSLMAKAVRRRGVQRTPELVRVAGLPRRDPTPEPELVALLTEHLRAPGGTMTLRPIQAAALRDIHDNRGALLPIGVGMGKALISLLAPVVLEARRPILLVPADLREQTNRKVLPQMAQHWRLHPGLRVIGYSEISLAKNADLLDRLEPDLLILDECHLLKHADAGRTRRVRRYLREHPECAVVAMSGTITSKSLRDFAHIAQWALGKHRAPVPDRWPELQDWALALDEGVADELRLAPGALADFCTEGESARDGYRRRLTETPGVVASGEDELGVSLSIRALKPAIPRVLLETIETIRRTWEDPNGDPFTEALALWRYCRQVAQGFWLEWDPKPPPAWLDARKAWKRYVAHVLKTNRTGLDTELQVWNASEGVKERADWQAVRDTYTPNPQPRWLDRSFLVDVAARWLADGDGVVWVSHPCVGEMLSAELGLPYYGSGPKASAEILDASGAIIASTAAHGQGKNLQQWSRNLMVYPSSSGKEWEQLIGRTHRSGQLADAVEVAYLACTMEQRAAFEKAQAEAKYIEEITGARQRLCYADLVTE